jgi:hypothetical protein
MEQISSTSPSTLRAACRRLLHQLCHPSASCALSIAVVSSLKAWLSGVEAHDGPHRVSANRGQSTETTYKVRKDEGIHASQRGYETLTWPAPVNLSAMPQVLQSLPASQGTHSAFRGKHLVLTNVLVYASMFAEV